MAAKKEREPILLFSALVSWHLGKCVKCSRVQMSEGRKVTRVIFFRPTLYLLILDLWALWSTAWFRMEVWQTKKRLYSYLLIHEQHVFTPPRHQHTWCLQLSMNIKWRKHKHSMHLSQKQQPFNMIQSVVWISGSQLVGRGPLFNGLGIGVFPFAWEIKIIIKKKIGETLGFWDN